MFHKSLIFLSLGLALNVGARADETTLQPGIEVTASRMSESVGTDLADVSVITRADIDASGAPDLIDLLRLQAGVDVVRGGGAGEQTSVFLRGTNSNHVLVLIDGVRVASSNTGAFAFENLPLDAVQRIEIVRGPRASYWGSDAIGGVIQIFTRRLDSSHLAASYGSYRSADGSAGFGDWSDAGGFSVQAGLRHVGGFSTQNPAGCCFNPDDNGYHERNLVAQGAYAIGTQMLSTSLFRNEGGVSFDEGYSHTLDQAIGVNLEGMLTSDWHQRLSVGTSREDLDTPAFLSAYYSTREQASWTNVFTLSDVQRVVAGFDYVHDHGISFDEYADAPMYARDRDDRGVFAGWRTRDNAFDSEISGRYDDYSDFGGAFSGSAALGWNLADGLRLSASYGTAFRAPNLNELFSPGYGGYYAGNPALDPEHSQTAEAGIEWHAAATSLQLRGFSTHIRDLIDFSGGDMFQAINIDRATIDGIEASQSWRNDAWSMNSTLTLQNPRDADNGTQLLRRPKRKFSNLIDRAIGDRWHAGVEFFASGRRADIGNVNLPGYALINLRASYVLNPSWHFSLRLENLLDREYELVHGYNTPGRSAYVQVAWQPDR